MKYTISEYLDRLAEGKMTLMDVPESVRVESPLISRIERYNAKKRDPAKKIKILGNKKLYWV